MQEQWPSSRPPIRQSVENEMHVRNEKPTEKQNIKHKTNLLERKEATAKQKSPTLIPSTSSIIPASPATERASIPRTRRWTRWRGRGISSCRRPRWRRRTSHHLIPLPRIPKLPVSSIIRLGRRWRSTRSVFPFIFPWRWRRIIPWRWRWVISGGSTTVVIIVISGIAVSCWTS
jgi:hypothetical protein